MTNGHVGVRPVPHWFAELFHWGGWMLILPPLLLGLLALVLAISTHNPLVIFFQLVSVCGYVCLARWFLALRQGQAFRLTRLRKAGLVFVPLSGAAWLALHFFAVIGEFPSIYYFSLAPTVLLVLCGLMTREPKMSAAERHSRRRWLLGSAGYLWLGLVTIAIVVSMLGTLSIRDLGQAAELVHPFNLVNWVIFVALAAPGLVLLKLSRQAVRV